MKVLKLDNLGLFMVFHGIFLVAQIIKHLLTTQETWVQSLAWEDPLEKKMATHSSILAWESHGQRSLVGYSSMGSQRV